jgi:hypothetical protein
MHFQHPYRYRSTHLALHLKRTMAGGAVILIIFQVFVLGEEFSFDMHYSHGIWGFLTPVPDRLPLELVTVLICNLCGTMG